MSGTTNNGLDEIKKIFKIINTFGSSVQTAASLYKFLTGSTPTDDIVNAIKEMETVISNELKLIANEIQLQTEYQRWQPFGTKITDIQASNLNIAQEFSTLTEISNQYVIRSSKNIPFDSWATNSMNGGDLPGALDQLYTNIQKIVDLFLTGGVVNAGPLDVWGSFYSAGRANNLDIFNGQHKLSAYFMFFQQINGMVAQTFFLHESILAFYSLQYGNSKSYNSIGEYIKNWFGDYKTENTVWNVFDKAMTFDEPVFEDFSIISTALDSWSNNKAPTYQRIADPGSPGGSVIWKKPFSVTDLDLDTTKYPNAFILDLQLVKTPNSDSDFPQMYVQAKVGCMQSGGAIEVVGTYHNCDLTAGPSDPNYLSFPQPGNAGQDGLWYVNTGYSDPGRSTKNNNKFYVITGFEFDVWIHGDSIASYDAYLEMKLQSGILDVTTIDTPTVSDIGSYVSDRSDGSGFGTFGYNGYENRAYTIPPEIEFWNTDFGGNASGFPIDDISFARVHNVPGQWNGNEVGFLLRSNFTIHQADFLQPTNSLCPHAYKTNS